MVLPELSCLEETGLLSPFPALCRLLPMEMSKGGKREENLFTVKIFYEMLCIFLVCQLRASIILVEP